MASSTTMPDGEHEPNKERLFSEKHKQLHHGECADERHRHGEHRNDGGAPVLQEGR
jgi:hypothetical protein